MNKELEELLTELEDFSNKLKKYEYFEETRNNIADGIMKVKDIMQYFDTGYKEEVLVYAKEEIENLISQIDIEANLPLLQDIKTRVDEIDGVLLEIGKDVENVSNDLNDFLEEQGKWKQLIPVSHPGKVVQKTTPAVVELVGINPTKIRKIRMTVFESSTMENRNIDFTKHGLIVFSFPRATTPEIVTVSPTFSQGSAFLKVEVRQSPISIVSMEVFVEN